MDNTTTNSSGSEATSGVRLGPERNSMDSTTKKIPLFNVPQKFKDLLKKFEYVEEPIVREQISQQSTQETEKKIAEKNLLTTEQACLCRSLISPPLPLPETINLSLEQQEALNRFLLGENLFVTGPGGTGKTHLIKLMVKHAITDNKRIQVCALTGCAAVLLQCNARTIHSWSGIKLAKGSSQNIIGNVLKNRMAMKAWKTTQILIIDEVSMMSQKILNILNKIGQTLRNNTRPFGGIQVVFCGDFFQLGPIGEPEEPETGMFCFESPHWFSIFPQDNHIELKTIFRQRDPAYINVLSEVRRGELSQENIDLLQKYVKREYDPEQNNGCVLTKLFPVRNRADYINKLMFEQIAEPVQTFPINVQSNCRTYLESGKPIENMILDKCDRLTMLEREREIELMMMSNNMPKTLDLKKGAAVMCTANLDLDKGICNGSQGVIIELLGTGPNRQPKVKFNNGVIFMMPVHFVQSDEYPTIAIGQIPLTLAWALTIHKIQGATLALAQMDIGQAIFEYGQTYVALSRIQSLEGLYLSSFEPGRIRANPKVQAFYKKCGEPRFPRTPPPSG